MTTTNRLRCLPKTVSTIDQIINYGFVLATAILVVVGLSLAVTVAVIAITKPAHAITVECPR